MSIVALLLALEAASQPVASRYDDCVALVAADLDLGRLAAQQWVDAGGGANARHCLAIADLQAGFPKLAAVRLQDIAERRDAGDDLIRARLLSQSAEAWLEADDPDQALAALERAFELAPDAGELHLKAVKVFAAQENWQGVIDAVGAAEEAGFSTAEAYVLRGRAHKAFGSFETAAQDVVNALTLDPVNLDALVLRGELQQAGVVIDVFYQTPNGETSDGETPKD